MLNIQKRFRKKFFKSKESLKKKTKLEVELEEIYIKNKFFVRCGIRTHVQLTVPELESGALDHSANLTIDFICQNSTDTETKIINTF